MLSNPRAVNYVGMGRRRANIVGRNSLVENHLPPAGCPCRARRAIRCLREREGAQNKNLDWTARHAHLCSGVQRERIVGSMEQREY